MYPILIKDKELNNQHIYICGVNISDNKGNNDIIEFTDGGLDVASLCNIIYQLKNGVN